jgi:two-component sensor histidine kinase
MGVGQSAATTLALVMHELATNSLKHGALSSATGVLDVSADSGGNEITLIWTEQGGPPVIAPSGEGGFGSQLVRRAMSNQLGGSMDRTWAPEGVVVTLRIDKARLAS